MIQRANALVFVGEGKVMEQNKGIQTFCRRLDWFKVFIKRVESHLGGKTSILRNDKCAATNKTAITWVDVRMGPVSFSVLGC